MGHRAEAEAPRIIAAAKAAGQWGCWIENQNYCIDCYGVHGSVPDGILCVDDSGEAVKCVTCGKAGKVKREA